MARTLRIRQPNAKEIRRLESVLETTSDPQIQRRSEVLLDYALDIAAALHVHANTVYADLRAFAREGLSCLAPLSKGGTPARITAPQLAEIWRLAECVPGEFGLPEGRWSLASFQDFLVKKRRLLKRISPEQLRRVLKKRTSASGGWTASWSVMIRHGGRF